MARLFKRLIINSHLKIYAEIHASHLPFSVLLCLVLHLINVYAE